MIIDLAAALTAVKTLRGIRDFVEDSDDAFLTNQLQLSVGVNAAGVTVYRIYYVAAQLLLLDSDGGLKSSEIKPEDKYEYFNAPRLLQNLLKLQAQEDAALGLTVADEFLANRIGAAIGSRTPQWTPETVRCLDGPDYNGRYTGFGDIY